ncbi:MAG: SHOCT domain-containing protein [Candidatus Gastranaerophilaceae bacterium]
MYQKEALIAKIIELNGYKPFFVGHITKRIMSILREDEELLGYQKAIKFKDKYGEFILTNKHVYFVRRFKQIEFSFKNINHVTKTKGVFFSDLTLSGSGFSVKFECILKKKADEYCAIIQPLITLPINAQNEEKEKTQTTSENDTVLSLRQLKELYEKGLISENEYTAKKREVLNRI